MEFSVFKTKEKKDLLFYPVLRIFLTQVKAVHLMAQLQIKLQKLCRKGTNSITYTSFISHTIRRFFNES